MASLCNWLHCCPEPTPVSESISNNNNNNNKVLEADEIKHEAMKGNIHTEYFRRVRSILKSRLSGGNIMRVINSRAISIIRYGAGIINWTKEELRNIDRKTRKLLTTQNVMHWPKAMWTGYIGKGRKAGGV